MPIIKGMLVILLLDILIIAVGYVYLMGFPPLFQDVEASTSDLPLAALTQSATPTPTSTLLALRPALAQAAVLPTQTASVEPTLVRPSATRRSPTLAVEVTIETPAATVAIVDATATPATPTPGPALETPFGPQGYLIHQVASGEYWEFLARLYNTTDEVLRTLNGMDRTDVLYVDKIIVILPGVKDASQVQPRAALYLYNATEVQSLAESYQITPDQLRLENGLGSEPVIPGRRWLVVPIIKNQK